MPPNPSSASRFSSQTVTSSPASPASATAWSASQAGFLRLDGTEASVRDRQLAPPIATARSSAGRSASARPARTTRATGTCSGGALRQREREGAQDRADHERLEADRGLDRGDRGGHRGPVEHRPGQRGAGPAEVVGARGAEADQQHLAQLGVLRGAQRDRQHGHLADLARTPAPRRAPPAGRRRAARRPRRRPGRAPGPGRPRPRAPGARSRPRPRGRADGSP